jgi:predicted PhzF superfamily epimerase YddE/YHI9
VLWETGELAPDQQARFHTRSGLLIATWKNDWIELNFPAKVEKPAPETEGFAAALGVTPLYVVRNQFDYLVEIESEAMVRGLQPNFSALKSLGARGVIVTSRASTVGYDFVSRFFAPGSGIDEDPVTGSAHCCLGPYWQPKLGKDTFVAYQASARGGVLRVQVAGDRVLLEGQAVTVMRAELLELDR